MTKGDKGKLFILFVSLFTQQDCVLPVVQNSDVPVDVARGGDSGSVQDLRAVLFAEVIIYL